MNKKVKKNSEKYKDLQMACHTPPSNKCMYNNRMNEGVVDNGANKSRNAENSINMPNSVQLTKLHLKALSNFYKICLSLQNTDKLMK